MARTAPTPALRISDEVFDLFLDEAERALIEVDSRSDEPLRRAHRADDGPESTAELRLAIAELSDTYPGMHFELESLSERLRSVGIRAALLDLEARPHVVQLVRLSLEVFFRMHPTAESFEIALQDDEDEDEDGLVPTEIWEAHRHLLGSLRTWVS